jgi:hypothetical protein
MSTSTLRLNIDAVKPSVLIADLGNPNVRLEPYAGGGASDYDLVIEGVDQAAADAAFASYTPPPSVTSDDINQERDRRIAGGFVFGGNTYQSDPESRQRIANAAIEAIEAIIGDVSGGNLRWSDPANDFTWRAADNSEIPMDAPSMVDLHKEARAHEAMMIRRAQALKANPPSDYTDDRHWI